MQKAARMITALGNLHVRKMFWREPEARRGEIGNEGRALGDVEDRRGWRRSANDRFWFWPNFFCTAKLRFSFFVFVNGTSLFQLIQARPKFFPFDVDC